jgi:hypothetical protein
MARRRILLASLVYLGVVLVTLVLFGSNWLSHRRFALEGVSTLARVVETTCGNHATFVYDFAARGRSHRSRGGDGYGNPRCEDLRPGDTVRIWYLPAAPDQSVAGEPAQRQSNEAMTFAVGALWFALFLALYIWRELRRPNLAVQPTGARGARPGG